MALARIHRRLLARPFGAGFGVCGSGGLFSIALSRSSARFIPSSFGSRSSSFRLGSALCGLRALFMVIISVYDAIWVLDPLVSKHNHKVFHSQHIFLGQ